MTSWIRNQLKKLCNAVSASVTATSAERLQGVRDTASLLYNRMMENMGYGQERLKEIVQKEAEEEQQQEEQEGVDLTPHEHEREFKGAYKGFVIPRASKTGIDSYFDLQSEMGSAKIIMTLWVRWKKPIKPLIELDPEDLEDAQDIGGNVGDKGRPAPPVSTSSQGIDELEKEEMKKSRSVIKK